MADTAAHRTIPAAPVEVRDLAHRAACSLHTDPAVIALCDMGGNTAAAVLTAVAGWLRDPTSGAAQTLLDAQREDATTNPLGSPLAGAQAVCDALAALLDGAS